MTEATDERIHDKGDEELWQESWYFDFAASDGSLGGYVRLGLYRNLGVAWYWAYLVGEGRPLVAVRDHEVALPRGQSLEVRAEGLWSDLNCETPLEHWSVGLEAFGVAMDDPADAYRGERGERVALGLDLEWEGLGPPYDYPGVTRYEQSCAVHGDVLIGEERIAFDGFGQRDHSWGPRDWWRFEWCWTAGRFGDGSAFHASRPEVPGIEYEPGYVLAPGGAQPEPMGGFSQRTDRGAEGLPTRAAMRMGEVDVTATPLYQAPILLTGADGRVSRFPRALCRFDAADGRSGFGWTEWLQLQPD